MNTLYRFCDQMLARLLELAGKDPTVIVVSDHGFLNDHRRPRTLGAADSPEGLAANWHREMGMICIAGENIKPDERIYGATLLDIAPTALMLLGIPPARDMDGKPLVQALTQPITLAPIASWDTLPGDAGSASTRTSDRSRGGSGDGPAAG